MGSNSIKWKNNNNPLYELTPPKQNKNPEHSQYYTQNYKQYWKSTVQVTRKEASAVANEWKDVDSNQGGESSRGREQEKE